VRVRAWCVCEYARKDINHVLNRGSILILERDGGVKRFSGPAGGGRGGFVPPTISVYLFPLLGSLGCVVTINALCARVREEGVKEEE
jgi:hypothetical protein